MKSALMAVSAAVAGSLLTLLLFRSSEVSGAQQGAAVGDGTLMMATGGANPNQNDLCWVLSKVKPAKGVERTVLSMYRARNNGAYFDLQDVRAIDADLRIVELQGSEHERNTKLEVILKALPKEEKEALFPKQP